MWQQLPKTQSKENVGPLGRRADFEVAGKEVLRGKELEGLPERLTEARPP